jgi:hypothetical protein
VEAGRSLAEKLRSVRKRPLPVADAVLEWVPTEAAAFALERRAGGDQQVVEERRG